MKLKKWIIATSFIAIFILIVSLISIAFYFFYIPKQYKREVNIVTEQFGVDKNLILAVMKVESNFQANAMSRVGAVGLMQLMPRTAQFITETLHEDLDINNYRDNIKMGAWYLQYLQNKFIDRKTVLAAYNAGEGTVLKWLRQNNLSLGDKLDSIPYKETNDYVIKVERFYKIYRKIQK